MLDETVTFTIWVVLLTMLESTMALVAVLHRDRPWLAVPLLWRLPWVVMQLLGVWYCILTGRYYLGTFGFPLSWWIFGVQLELLFVSPFFATLFLLSRRSGSRVGLATRLGRWMRSDAGIRVLYGLWAVGFGSYLAARTHRGIYGEVSAQMILSPGSHDLAALNLLAPFASLFWPASAGLLALTADCKRRGQTACSRLMRFLALAVMAAVSLDTLVYGQRTNFLMPLVMLAIGYAFCRRNLKRLLVPAAIIGLLAVGSTSLLADFRADRDALMGSPQSILSNLCSSALQCLAEPATYAQDAIHAIVSRADLYMNGAILARYAQTHGLAGLRPYEGLLYVWLPRSIVPDKPVIGSEDGTASGLPAYILGWLRSPHDYARGSSASRSVASEAYWQFGMPGVMVMGVTAGVWTALCARLTLAQRQPLGLGIYLYVDPGGTLVNIIYHQLLRRCLYTLALSLVFSMPIRARPPSGHRRGPPRSAERDRASGRSGAVPRA